MDQRVRGRSQVLKRTSALLSALTDYLSWAAENGPGCPSAGRTPPEWTRLALAIENAEENAPRPLCYRLTCLIINIDLYEQSTEAEREHRLSSLIQARTTYRHAADPWKEHIT